MARSLGPSFVVWPVMERRDDPAAYYRRKAEDAERAAAAAKDAGIKKAFEEIARSWLELAKRREGKG